MRVRGAFWKDNKFSTLDDFNAETDVFRDWDLYCATRANMDLAIGNGPAAIEEFFGTAPKTKKPRS